MLYSPGEESGQLCRRDHSRCLLALLVLVVGLFVHLAGSTLGARGTPSSRGGADLRQDVLATLGASSSVTNQGISLKLMGLVDHLVLFPKGGEVYNDTPTGSLYFVYWAHMLSIQ